ncbi:hypothetical protein D6C90_10390 [Aureobasidium pullulans]|uniref:Uncharacterized protein n=1 Tax=Aureobasidium pullulans TaxID=5580 RepID=A0A4S9SNP9_AURPU|nr:hypothetical protein D6C90_10390 [Aureobasidium pullulans]
MIDRGVGKASLVRASHSPTGRTLSRTVSHGEGARATPFAPTNSPSIISSALGPPGSDGISGIKRQSAGIPGLGDTILFIPRRSSACRENLNAERPFKKRGLVPPPSQRLPTNFDLDVNSTPVLFPPSRKLKIAEAARIDVSELSEETKRIMGYAVERPVDDNTVAPILGAQTDEVKTQASPVSRFSAGKTISAARAKLANGAGAKYNIKSTSESLTEDVSSIEMNPFVRIRPRFNMPAEEEDIEAADDGERNARVEAMMVFNPVIGAITVLRSSRNPVSVLKTHVSRSAHSKRVHFLALETLVQHTSIRLARYNDKKIFGPVLSMSFVLLHASFSSSPPNSAKLLSALEDFKGMLTLLLEKLRELLRTAQT